MAIGEMTPARRWVLECAATGARVEAAGGYQVHTSFTTGERWFGAPWRAHKACTEAGWLKDDRITEAGRRALSPETSP